MFSCVLLNSVVLKLITAKRVFGPLGTCGKKTSLGRLK